MKYVALAAGSVTHRELIPVTEDIQEYVTNREKPYYRSIYYYNQEQYDRWKTSHSLAGITDVVTDTLVWDLDDEHNLEQARKDAIELCSRLISAGVPKDQIAIAWSGKKGFGIEVATDKELSVFEFKNITQALAKDLTTYDTVVNDPQRILRITGTKHPDSNLYKFPLTQEQLCDLTPEQIKVLASDLNNAGSFEYSVAALPDSIYNLRMSSIIESKPPSQVTITGDLDFKFKPKGFSNCKFALLNGMFPNGTRSNALMALGATCRAQGYPKEVTYNMLKAAARLQGHLHDCEPFSKEEIWNNIVKQMYEPTWKGAQYSCKNQAWLKEICESLGPHKCKGNENLDIVGADEVFSLFQNYALNYEKNILTSGIESLDRRVKFLVGTSNGILAPPGVGKTSLSLSMLNHNSNLGVNSIFFSYDMFHSMVYLRLIQKHLGYEQDKVFKIFKSDPKESERIHSIIKKEYANVSFCFKSGQTAEDIDRTITEAEQKLGSKVKLIIVDYNELVISSTSDPTQASAQVAQQLRQIANDREVCAITLLQPAKVFSNPSEEITTYQGAKGSGAIAQSQTLMLSLSRPGFDPRNPENDRFFTINALKNRNGPLFSIDLGWNGLTGSMHELSDTDFEDLAQLREIKAAQKASDFV